MHPRICLHQVAFAKEDPVDFIEFCREIGIPHMTLATPLLAQKTNGTERIKQALAQGGPKVAILNHPFAMAPNLEKDSGEASTKLLQAIDIAASFGASAIYLITGGRGSLDWEQAAARFAELVAPCKANAAAKNIALLVEPASTFNADIHIVHTLADTIELAEMAGIGICIDLQPIWTEAGLQAQFKRAMPICGLVQVSDYVLGDRTAPCRAVPGDGAMPLERMIGDLLEAGYQGVFDLELVGPRIDAEGGRAASKRAADNLSEILHRLGA